MDLSACWMSQGWLFLPASPRSCELSPGHALEPSARYAGVCPVRDRRTNLSPRHVLGPTSLRTSASRSTPRRPSLRAPYRYGTGKQVFLSRDKVKDFIPSCGLVWIVGFKPLCHQRHPRTPTFTLPLRNAAKRRVSKGEAEAFPRGSSRASILRDVLLRSAPQDEGKN
jgi:hypothetical protein